jgi:hypothetical protein
MILNISYITTYGDSNDSEMEHENPTTPSMANSSDSAMEHKNPSRQENQQQQQRNSLLNFYDDFYGDSNDSEMEHENPPQTSSNIEADHHHHHQHGEIRKAHYGNSNDSTNGTLELT